MDTTGVANNYIVNSHYANGGIFVSTTSINPLGEPTVKLKNLYDVYMINKYGELEDVSYAVVAATEEEAKFKAGVYCTLTEQGLELDEVTVVVKLVHSVIKVEDRPKCDLCGDEA